ncbi:MAG TPA: metallophosphoesterase family protein [Anaeromyxobacteraceae bacterium]|nr:metallophosphoesterase family protein [Anaeromyxobacteraceae bacterium]
MKLALFADVHGNLEALNACLEHSRKSGADLHAFLGDFVGYGADPVAVVDIVAAHAQRGAIVVRGNHEQTVIDASSSRMNRDAEDAADWTREQLGSAHRAFIEQLPLVARLDDMVFVHASAASPEEFPYVRDTVRAAESLRAARSTYVFSGHVHEPALYCTAPPNRIVAFTPFPGVAVSVPRHRQWLAIVGSAGQPRDGRPAACYAVADLERRTLTFFRVPYDWHAAAAKIRAAGLPEVLAWRLERGE